MMLQVGLIYVFNLIVGTGALTMPKAFAEAGWLMSVIGVASLAFMRYVKHLQITWVVKQPDLFIRTDHFIVQKLFYLWW